MKHKVFIDSNKGITFIILLGMMAYYRQWQNPTAWVYVALHGTYGILWVLKSRLFPDKNWEKKVSLWFGLVSWIALVMYWFPGWLVMSRAFQAPAWLLAICVSLNIFGVFFVFTTDMQKYTALKLQPDALVSDGMMALSRNTNYFGEFLIYLSFAVLPLSWMAFIPLAIFVAFYWIPNMVRKDRSMSALPGFFEYKKKVRSFLPFIF